MDPFDRKEADEEEIKIQFKAHDVDADGVLNLNEFQTLFGEADALISEEYSTDKIKGMWEDFTKWQSKEWTCDNFVDWCLNDRKGRYFMCQRLQANISQYEGDVNEEFLSSARTLASLNGPYTFNEKVFPNLPKALQADATILAMQTHAEMVIKCSKGGVGTRESFMTLLEEYKSSPNFLFNAVRINGHNVMSWLPPEINENAGLRKELMLSAVRYAGIGDGFDQEEKVFKSLFPPGSPDFADKDVMKILVTKKAKALQFASTTLRGDKDLVLTAVSCGGQKYVAQDKRLGSWQVTDWGGESLQYASKELRADKEVVFKALKLGNKFGRDVLQFASPELQKDEVLMNMQAGNSDAAEAAMKSRLSAEDYGFC